MSRNRQRSCLGVLTPLAILSLFLVPNVANADFHCPQDGDVQDPDVEPKPVVLFVPGFTSLAGEVFNFVTKPRYFESQRGNLADDYEVVYMNDCDDFDSDRGSIQPNADAIVRVLEAIRNRPEPSPVIIVSHSKGGQDTLHALAELDNEENLPYRDPSLTGEASGIPLHRPLWDTVEGWVAYTSNFFESEFPIVGERGFGIPNICIPIPFIQDCNVPSTICPPDDCPSRYENFLVVPGEEHATRQQYMFDHQDAIGDLMECVPTISAYATYVPTPVFRAGALDEFNRGIRVESTCGANDGLVPARTGKLPGASIRRLPTDEDSIGLNGQQKCGVDHYAPAVAVANPFNRFWTEGFRNSETRRFISAVDEVPEFPAADAGADQTLECESHDGSIVTLDGTMSVSGSPDFPRGIATHEWFENSQLIATGAEPTLTLPLGVHQITLRVTDNCWRIGEDQVVVTVRDTLPPEVDLEVDPTTLWPPNHKLELVADGVSASDVCDPNPTLLATVASNEPVNGLGDGNTDPDWEVAENVDGTLDVSVRAERSGVHRGREYQISATAIDGSGNSATEQATATVEHDQRNRRPNDQRRRQKPR